MNELGVIDYGIYGVVGGFVSMFGFINSSMAQATQRFLSFDLGKEDYQQLHKTFSTTLSVQIFFAAIIVLALQTFGLWYINNRLNVPQERLHAVNIVYQFSVFTLFISFLHVPYEALIRAHEKFIVYTNIGMVEIALKILVLLSIIYLDYDKLILYGALLFCTTLLIQGLYLIYCLRHFPESRYKFYFEKKYFLKVLSFTGWSLYGRFSDVIKTQATTLLINQMFNPTVVAARSISANLSGQVYAFSTNFTSSLNPAIIKLYSSGQREELFELIYRGARMSFFLMWIFTLPVIIEMPTILELWLKTPPEGAILFSRLVLIDTLIFTVSHPIAMTARATGNISKYELILGTLQLTVFFISWLVLWMGYPPYSVYLVSIAISLVMFVVRINIVKQLIYFKIVIFLRRVILPLVSVVIITSSLSILVSFKLNGTIIQSGLLIFTSILISCLTIYVIGMSKSEQSSVLNFARRFVTKKK